MRIFTGRVRGIGVAAAGLTFLGALFAAPAALSARADIEYAVYEPSPAGTVLYARTPVLWRVIPLRGSRVTGVSLHIDDRAVEAFYDPVQSAVVHKPLASLEPGTHKVRAVVTLDGEAAIDREWEFEIDARAVSRLPAPRNKQSAVLKSVNRLRRGAGLPELTPDPRLFAAAQAHADYLRANDAGGHVQVPGRRGFVGERPNDRARAFGYGGGSYEDVSQGLSEPATAVQGLFDAPYHREPFLQLGGFDFGSGVSGDRVSVLFGVGEKSGVVMYPGDGQQDVPLAWDGNETPDPLRLHRSGGARGGRPKGPFGYVVTLFVYDRELSAKAPPIRIRSALLATPDGKIVPAYVNTPDNDPALRNGVFLIPQSPLKPGTTYRALVEVDRGRTVETVAWSFRTTSAR